MAFTTSTNLTTRRRVGRSGYNATLIGIHTMEAPEAGQTAENVAAYFKRVDASSHWCVDNNSRVRVVKDEDSAWTMPPTNSWSLNIEMAGYAGQSNIQWHDGYSLAVLDIAAVCAVEWCKKYDIPVRRLTSAQLLRREKGFAGHVDVNRAFRASDHSDPGPNFPWRDFFNLVNKHLGQEPARPSAGAPAGGRKNCTSFQTAIRTPADNMWGKDTDKNANALIGVSGFYGDAESRRFPYGVTFAQKVVGTNPDNHWGPMSKDAMKRTVTNAQKALTGMGFNTQGSDGIWGPNTDSAYQAARKACHI
jgi:N-acetyl-anhydromuramyl-L-alanine amidase AmpD